MVIFLSQLNDLEIWGADVGNAYLEAYTDEKLCIIAGPEFKELQGHLLIMIKALYGTRSGGARWHDRLFDILQELKFKPSKADPDVWMRPEPGGTCYEYIAVYVDDLAIAAKDPQAFCNELKKRYNLKLKGVGPLEYHLGCTYKKDPDGTLAADPRRYVNKILESYERMFKEKPRKSRPPLEGGDHPELDTSELCDEHQTKQFQTLIGQLQWLISLGCFDIAVHVMSLSRFRAQPRKGHLDRAKRIVGYLLFLPDGAIRFRTGDMKSPSESLISFIPYSSKIISLNLITNTKIRLKMALDLPSITPTLSRTPLVVLLAAGYSVCSTSVLYSITWHLQLFKAYALSKLSKELLQTLVSCFISHFMSLSTTGLILLSLISTFLHHLMKRRVIGAVLLTTKVTVSPGGSSLRILKRSSFVLAFEVPSELQQTSVLHHLQGRGPHFLFSIPYPQQSKNSLPLDPFDESTPNFEQFVNSQSGEDEDNPIHMANIDIPNLLGRSFLLPPEDNGEHHMAKIIDIDDHGQPLEDIKFKLKINKDQADEIMSYNQLMDYIQKGTEAEEDPDSLFEFRDIVAHQGPLESTDPDHKGSKYNVMVEWESGQVTYEPLTLISKDDPITCAVYAKKHDLLDTTGWKHLKRYAKTSKRLIRAVKQSMTCQVRASAQYQHGFQVPKDYNDAIRLDKKNSNTHWQDAMDLELTQIHEYKVSRTQVKHNSTMEK